MRPPRKEPRLVEIETLSDGTITSVAQQKRDLDRVSVFLDGEFRFGLSADIAVAERLKKGLHLTAQRQYELLAMEERMAAKRAAIDAVSQRGRTSAEIRRSLSQRGFSEAAVDEAIAELERYGYLDDEAFAQAFVEARGGAGGHGPQRLRADLLKKGVARGAIDAALETLEADDLLDSARALAAKRWAALASETDPRKRRKKTSDFLLRRGFGFDTVRQAVDAASEGDDDEADAWESP